MTYSVKFLPHNVSVEVDDNESLIRAAMEAGIHINASCGGGGVCGKCRVLIEEGNVDGGISEHLSSEDQEKGYRMACLSEVTCDLVVRIPVESEIDTSRLNVHAGSRHTAKVMYSNIDELRQDGLFIPPVEKIYLELDSATTEDNQADVARIINHLRLKHDEHRLTMGLDLIRKVSDILREGDFKITVTIVRPLTPVTEILPLQWILERPQSMDKFLICRQVRFFPSTENSTARSVMAKMSFQGLFLQKRMTGLKFFIKKWLKPLIKL